MVASGSPLQDSILNYVSTGVDVPGSSETESPPVVRRAFAGAMYMPLTTIVSRLLKYLPRSKNELLVMIGGSVALLLGQP